MTDPATTTPGTIDVSESEVAAVDMGEEVYEGDAASYPPFPPYSNVPAPPSVAETIIAGRDLRRQFKHVPQKPVHPPPKPAKPKGPKATDVKMLKSQLKAHSRCLRRHGAMLTDRLEYMAKPRRRNIIYLWREYAHILPPETIARIRSMLDADEPFKPDQAYEYFVNLRKTKKKKNKKQVQQIKRDMIAMCDDKRFLWARNATIAFARGIRQRLSRPGRYVLADGMLRLSNVILNDVCGFMRMRTPLRNSTSPKARFMMEMSDKIAVWIDEILMESNDRMLMMDFDEDEDIIEADAAGDAGFADDFLNMMRGGDDVSKVEPAFKQFTGDMLEAFTILTNAMFKKGDENLTERGKFKQSYSEAANLLKKTPTFRIKEIISGLSKFINNALTDTVKQLTPNKLEPAMREIIYLCSNFLAENAELNKHKGPAFKILVETMRKKSNEILYESGKEKERYGGASIILNEARSLESDHGDPNLTKTIQKKLFESVEGTVQSELRADMDETIDICSRYLSQNAIDKAERGPAFELMLKALVDSGAEPFTPEFSEVDTKFAAAHALEAAPGLASVQANPEMKPKFEKTLHEAVDLVTPKHQKKEMEEVVTRGADYLSGFVRDRHKALELLLKTMKKYASKELARRNDYAITFGSAASEIEKSPTITPYLPVKDIKEEIKEKLAASVENSTPDDLKVPIKTLINDVAEVLSQSVAMKSDDAGEKYPMDFLIAVKKSMGNRPLYEHKGYKETYAQAADTLQNTNVSESDDRNEALKSEIAKELNRNIPLKVSPTIASELVEPVNEASQHLASIGTKRGIALEHLTGLMKEKGKEPLASIQGYDQTYSDGARRISNAPSLTAEKVDKQTYAKVKEKLQTLSEQKPAPENIDKVQLLVNAHCPLIEMVDESSKFLATPAPEVESEKRQLLADLMACKEDELMAETGVYKLTYQDAAKEVVNSPSEPSKPLDEEVESNLKQKINEAVTDKKLQTVLSGTVNEAASNLANIVKGRGEVVQLIHDGMVKENEKLFVSIGDFKKTHKQVAEMLENAPSLAPQRADPSILETVSERVKEVPIKGVSSHGEAHVKDGVQTVSNYIAGVATEKNSDRITDMINDVKLAPTEAGETAKGAKDTGKSVHINENDEKSTTGQHHNLNTKSHSDDLPHEEALQLLHQKLKARGDEIFYKQPRNELTYAQASEWLSNKPFEVEKAVKDSPDAARMHKKFERKLGSLVGTGVAPTIQDAMQDVIIETSRDLSEYFMTKSYGALAREAVISEMQKRCNEVLIKDDGAQETYFYAAQRLKKAKTLETSNPSERDQYYITKKLEEMIRSRNTLRKISGHIKDFVQNASKYLSAHVNQPDTEIDAYVALISEMEAAGGEKFLVEGKIPKTHREAAAYLRQLTSYDDEINRDDKPLQSRIEFKLHNLMGNAPMTGYDHTALNQVIQQNAKLLTSYVKLQDEKMNALNLIVKEMDKAGENVLLRHGTLRKTNHDGANVLRDMNIDNLKVTNVDPVVSRKIQIKLQNLMHQSSNKYTDVMKDVVHDATKYLAVQFLVPEVIQVCKCMKSVCVQCELWCENTIPHMARRRCECTAAACPLRLLRISDSESCPCTSRLQISLKRCPSTRENPSPCPASKPSPGCKSDTTAAYLLYTSHGPYDDVPTKLSEDDSQFNVEPFNTSTKSCYSPRDHPVNYLDSTASTSSTIKTSKDRDLSTVSDSLLFVDPASCELSPLQTFENTTTLLYAHEEDVPTDNTTNSILSEFTKPSLEMNNVYSSRTPIITTDQMSDWHSMMVSLMWNVQAWRVWIYDNINKLMSFHERNEMDELWTNFQRKTTMEVLQWHNYYNFSRQIISRIASIYKNRKIMSPTRTTVKTKAFVESHDEMLDVIDQFNRWSHWLSITIKEADLLLQYKDHPLSERWRVLTERVNERKNDWKVYDNYLSLSWEVQFKTLISDWICGWQESGPVWVMSACGAVPSGAFAAGLCDGEAIWVARTTHKTKVLPAALYPSRHCCVLYWDGKVYHYTKYQVLCNSSAQWVAWRASPVPTGSVHVGGVFVGRVHHRGSHLLGPVLPPRFRCHVMMFNRPVAFQCYELLVEERT